MKVFLVLFLFIIQLNPELKACTCFHDFERDTSECTAIFIGKVVDSKYNKFWYYGRPKTILTFEVGVSYRGLSEDESYYSVVASIGGCGSAHFVKDSVYLVFAYGDEVLYTNDCTCSGLLSERNDLLGFLGNSKTHSKSEWQLKEIQADEAYHDSLRTKNAEMQDELNIKESQVGSLKEYQKLLVITIAALILLAIYATFKWIKR